ncbi:PREDICTED: tRNA (cytosine(34)-C(5))-methyltransferase-like [Priapulus caudatus]|uniref:tRNA (cytosine(34)-C(5))-methyltransferase n=1 Tax=Priapulus caudatus TaxID=37621 RepID=A0ABM1EQX3_PRICU|nr:PREDICTED: tRNA (cytosine(34)-C(5))-methyltransferase-like [Priapulus caudatus]
MGRRKDKRKFHKKEQEQSKDGQGWKNDIRGAGYLATPKENQIFEKYYKEQGIIPEEEWDQFIDTLRRPLPSSFRITGFKSQAKAVLAIIKSEFFSELMNRKPDADEESLPKPTCISWYPDELAWQLNINRTIIRKSVPLQKLHHFLITETESGNISRQETVSMIPPLLMDVKPHHSVLDMCAAPGSKTAQLIEMLHTGDTTNPEGFVIANDSDNKRCYLLVHQTKRLESPCFMITNQDASHMPNLLVTKPDGQKTNLLYDRILCDVPCSGDGTLRKNVDMWRKWVPQNSNNLHGLQLRILRRGLELLEEGGRLVYSTCSMNPVENEAVIASMLNNCEGSVELVDISQQLPALKRQPGLTSWKVMSKAQVWYSSMDEVPELFHTQIRGSIFPPANVQQLHLENCLRILPHHQDTGGFFVAVLQKNSRLPWMTAKPPKVSAPVEEDGSNAGEGDGEKKIETRAYSPPKKKFRYEGYKEDPYIFLDPDDPILPPIKEFYGLGDTFPVKCLMTRCLEGQKRHLYLSSPAVKDIIVHNEQKIKIINTGVKILARSNKKGVDCDFRLCQEGSRSMLPYITTRVLEVAEQEDIVTLLTQENPFLYRMSPPLHEKLKNISTGSICFLFNRPASENASKFSIEIVGWRGKVSVRSFVPKDLRMHILRLCGVDVSTIDKAFQLKLEKIENKRKTDGKYQDDDEEGGVNEAGSPGDVESTDKDTVTDLEVDRQDDSTKILSGVIENADSEGKKSNDGETNAPMEENSTSSIGANGDGMHNGVKSSKTEASSETVIATAEEHS